MKILNLKKSDTIGKLIKVLKKNDLFHGDYRVCFDIPVKYRKSKKDYIGIGLDIVIKEQLDYKMKDNFKNSI